MSINYYGIATADPKQVGLLVEGNPQDGVPLLDTVALYTALTTRTRVAGPENATLRWEDSEGGYVFVDLSPTCALITHGTGGSESLIDVLMDVQYALNQCGVNIWDPQQGKWFPGSPVKPKKAKAAAKPNGKSKAKAKGAAKPKSKAKAKGAAKAKAKAKPKAKAKAKPKAKAKTKSKAKKK